MTLRSCGRDTVPMTGPRSRALSAPQWIGKCTFAPGSGCDVSRIWSLRLERFMVRIPKGRRPAMMTGRTTETEESRAVSCTQSRIIAALFADTTIQKTASSEGKNGVLVALFQVRQLTLQQRLFDHHMDALRAVHDLGDAQIGGEAAK